MYHGHDGKKLKKTFSATCPVVCSSAASFAVEVPKRGGNGTEWNR